jgi:ADP-ribose pyrophosphatase YjhB (NUDIX family)
LAADIPTTIAVLPTKRSVALLIRKGERILSVRRPDGDDELPGVWGVPAGSYRDAETLAELVARIGRDKLGVTLKPLRKLTQGRQQRDRYILDMELWETEIVTGTPQHPEWKWTTADTLQASIAQGSLCCRLVADVLKSEAAARSGSDADRKPR